jgi:hypothetical protein
MRGGSCQIPGCMNVGSRSAADLKWSAKVRYCYGLKTAQGEGLHPYRQAACQCCNCSAIPGTTRPVHNKIGRFHYEYLYWLPTVSTS